MIANVGLSTEGCLLSRTIAPADADTFLLPLIAPVILEERLLDEPLPGDLVLLDAPMGGDSSRKTFLVRVLYDAPANLQVKIFRDRDRDRECNPRVSPNTCGTPISASSGTTATRVPNTAIERTVSFTVSMRVPGECSAIDLYLSPQFRIAAAEEHRPVRDGEVAHARWIVAVRQSNGEPPSLQLCTAVR